MAKSIKTVGDLRSLLEGFDDDTAIEVAAAPDIVGWTQNILGCLHREEDVVVLGLAEEGYAYERKLVFRDNEENVVRPV